jgi:hypothetical protein
VVAPRVAASFVATLFWVCRFGTEPAATVRALWLSASRLALYVGSVSVEVGFNRRDFTS